MPKRSNDFQRLVHFLEMQLAPEEASVRESVMVVPVDGGEPAEVDVLIEARLGHHFLRVALECRDHRRPASVEWINQLAGRYAALPVDKVIAVSRSGFTSGARHRAKGTKIQLLTLEQANETNWPEAFRGWRFAFVELEPTPQAVRVTFHGVGPHLTASDLKGSRITNGSGTVASTVLADAQELYRVHARRRLGEWWPTQARQFFGDDPEQTWTVDLDFKAQDRSLITPDGHVYEIEALIIEVACTVRVRKPPAHYYEYGGARMTEFTDAEELGDATRITLLHDPDTGIPRSLNLRSASRADLEARSAPSAERNPVPNEPT